MFKNISGIRQSVKNFIGQYVPILPNEIVSEKVYNCVSGLSSFERVKKFNFNDIKAILLKRTHSLGDVVMTFPIVNYFRSIGKIVTVNTSTRYKIDGVDFLLSNPHISTENFDVAVDLDLVLEMDHYDPNYYNVHRVDIYKEYLNLKGMKNDWSVSFDEFDVDVEDAVIGVQLYGATKAKRSDLTKALDMLEQNNIKFFVIDYKIPDHVLKYKNVVVKQQSICGLLNVFRKLRGIVCFDSGPLWLSHITNTPAFVISGPTPGHKLIRRHPNSKSCYYDAKKDCGCKLKNGCGESMSDCNDFKCLRSINQDRFTKELHAWIERL